MATVTDNNHGPLLNVGSWITMVAMCITVGSKLYTKWATLRRLQLDDWFALFATMTAVGQCIASSIQVQYGLGQHQATLAATQMPSFYMAQYAAQILYLITIFAAKLISLAFFITLTGKSANLRKQVVKVTVYLVLAWILTGTLVEIFQCHLPQPWIKNPDMCINQSAFWTFNGVLDLVTQIVVSFFPVYLLSGLHSSRSKLRFAMLSFSPNILTIPLIITRLVYFYQTSGSLDYTWNSLNLALVTNLHTSISVIIACVPFSKPIIDSLVSAPGIITIDPSEFMASSKRPNLSNSNFSSSRSWGKRKFQRASSLEWPQNNPMGNHAAATSATPDHDDGLPESEFGAALQDRMVILQTMKTTVTSN